MTKLRICGIVLVNLIGLFEMFIFRYLMDVELRGCIKRLINKI